MCEPMHSIVQFPSQDDDGNPTETRVDALVSKDKEGWLDYGKRKFREWFHLSKMGLGHSETIGAISLFARRLLPLDTKYEVAWWERKTRLDGMFYGGHQSLKEDALKSADDYARVVSIGNMTLLRQFLETSIKRSQRPQGYVDRFFMMLVPLGKDLLNKRLKLAASWPQTIKVLMGFTRKRNLLVPEWADDAKIWQPV